MMNFLKLFTQNCFLLLVPVFLWNAVCYKKLPEMYQNRKWDNIPRILDFTENILRAAVFISPFFLQLSFPMTIQKTGLVVYSAGVFIYFISWIMQIKFPDSKWSRSAAGSTAPAYTTIIWLTGISLIGQNLNLKYRYNWYYYLTVVIAFVFVHTLHAYIVYHKNIPGRKSR